MMITTKEEYNYCLSSNVNPLFWNRIIKMDPELRVSIQNELFGHTTISKQKITRANDKYYHYCWEYSVKCCENCGQKLYKNKNIDVTYSATFISHILTKGAHPEMAHDPRNHNILCFNCHEKWENGRKIDMIVYQDNQVVIKELINDYRYL